MRAGVGWIEDGINTDPESELLYTRAESWRNVLYDSHSVKLDISDARYLFRWRWLDLDIAEEFFPDRKEQLRSAAVGSEIFGPEQDEDVWYLGTQLQHLDTMGNPVGRRSYISDALFTQNRRQRVKLIECWYFKPSTIKTLKGGDYDDEYGRGRADESDGGDVWGDGADQSADAVVRDGVEFEWGGERDGLLEDRGGASDGGGDDDGEFAGGAVGGGGSVRQYGHDFVGGVDYGGAEFDGGGRWGGELDGPRECLKSGGWGDHDRE